MRGLQERLERLEANAPAERRVFLMRWKGCEPERCGDIVRGPGEPEPAFLGRVESDLLKRPGNVVIGWLERAHA